MNRQMTKKILSALLTVVMVLSALPLGGMVGLDIFAATASALSSGVFEYEVADGKATITACDDSVSGELTIPDSIDGYPVTGIGSGAFNECSGVTTLTIPEGVTSIGSGAFNECYGLISAVIPEGVTAIENNLFYCCHNLETVTLPSTVTSIGDYAFGACYKLKNIALPQGVTSIGDGAFGGCQSLEEVNLQSVISIGNKAFSACLSLEEITIPESTVEIGYTAFENCKNITRINISSGLTSFDTGIFLGCDKLESVTVAADNPMLSSDGNGVVYNKDKTQLVYYPDGKTGTTFTVPDGVTSIGKSAFANESDLTSVTLPESIEKIGQYAFSSCTNLASITLPESIEKIEQYAFSSCTNLASITLPESIEKIGQYAFSSCTNLASITLPESIEKIEQYTFSSCTNLASVTLPESIKIIDRYAFLSCTNLTDVYYGGTQREWNNVVINVSNNELFNATKHFTAKPVYTVEFYDGDTLLGSKELEVGEESTLTNGAVPTREESRFMGWKIIGGDGTVFEDGTAIKDLADTQGAVVKFRAVWEWISGKATIVHEGTGVMLEVYNESYSDGVTLEASVIDSGEAYDIARNIDETCKWKVYTVDTLVNGVSTLPNGEVRVYLPIPDDFDLRKRSVYGINTEDNSTQRVSYLGTHYVGEQRYVYFQTDRFGTWAVVEKDYRMTSLELRHTPWELQYVRGEEVSTIGLEVYAYYSSGTIENVTDKVTVTNFSTEKAGKFTATVEYKGETATFDYEVFTKTRALLNTIRVILWEFELLFGYAVGIPGIFVQYLFTQGFAKLGELFQNIIT